MRRLILPTSSPFRLTQPLIALKKIKMHSSFSPFFHFMLFFNYFKKRFDFWIGFILIHADKLLVGCTFSEQSIVNFD